MERGPHARTASRTLAPGSRCVFALVTGFLPAANPARRRRVAVGAVDGLIVPGNEWNAGLAPALRAGRGKHLALRAVAIAGATVGALASFRAAGRAAPRVLIPSRRVECLVVGAEVELGAALDTGQGAVGIVHAFFHLWSGQELAGQRLSRAGRMPGNCPACAACFAAITVYQPDRIMSPSWKRMMLLDNIHDS
jgi:hypothetical protein